MTVQEAIRPYIGQADRDLRALHDLRDQMHDVMIGTARRVAENRGSSQALVDALEGVTVGLQSFKRGLNALVRARAEELWLGH